jgi:V/A-type H+-transporting ATPase subunit E
MENKIQELTDKLYREGVEKGNAEAERLIAAAKEKAAELIAKAQEEAAEIVDKAKKKAAETDENTRTELCQFAGQAKHALQSEIANLVSNQVVKESVASTIDSKDFLGQFLVALAGKWTENEPIVIESDKANELRTYFAAKAKALLDKGVTIKEVNGVKSLFTVKPVDGSYKVEFGQEEFENYFKAFLRPQLIEMLF